MTIKVQSKAQVTIDLSQSEAANIARQVVENSHDQSAVVDIAVLAMDNLLQSPEGSELLHATLKAHGMTLNHIEGWTPQAQLVQRTPTKTAKANSIVPRLQRINRLIQAFELSEGLLAQMGCSGTTYENVVQGAWQRFHVPDELDDLCKALEEHVLQPKNVATNTQAESPRTVMVEIALLEGLFNVTRNDYAQAGIAPEHIPHLLDRNTDGYMTSTLHDMRELLRAHLLATLKGE
jgi:hypothetical protein